jgi:hypothetical protein
MGTTIPIPIPRTKFQTLLPSLNDSITYNLKSPYSTIHRIIQVITPTRFTELIDIFPFIQLDVKLNVNVDVDESIDWRITTCSNGCFRITC